MTANIRKPYRYLLTGIFVLIVLLFFVKEIPAKIPEPGNIIYGFIGNDIDTVSLKIDDRVIASYTKSTDPETSNYYILRLPIDSVGPRELSDLRTGDKAAIYINDESEPAIPSVIIGERGTVQEINLAEGVEIPDYTDNDMDGIPDAIENGAPNNGDGNNDGLLDSGQENVTSLVSINGTDYVTITSPDGTVLSECRVIENPSPENTPVGYLFPYGFFEFKIDKIDPGAATQAIIYLPEDSIVDTYFKFGRTPDNLIDHWYEFYYENEIGAQIEYNMVTMNFIDGKYGDDDLDAENGSIKDPGGPAVSSASQAAADDDSSGGSGGGGGCFIETAFF